MKFFASIAMKVTQKNFQGRKRNIYFVKGCKVNRLRSIISEYFD